MSAETISAVDADLARVTSAQTHLAAAHTEEVPVGSADPNQVQRGHAAVAAAEAALAQAQAALAAAQAGQASAAPPGHAALTISPEQHHLVDSVA